MMTVKYLVLISFVTAIELCPTWVCDISLPDDTCASFTDGNVQLNDRGCDSLEFCSKDEILRFYRLVADNGRDSGTVKCIDFHYDSDDISDYNEDDVDD